ncbi:MAG: acetate--CoA ligase [Rickettsiales bacterium]
MSKNLPYESPSLLPPYNLESHEAARRAAAENPDAFWAAQAQALHWHKNFSRVCVGKFGDAAPIRWFDGGEINAAFNCLDRHLPALKDKKALLWEPDAPNSPSRAYSYGELCEETTRLAAGLRRLGVKKGDVVAIYLPLVPETVCAMLACARIGAVHSVVFGGFSSHALAGRIQDAKATALITADASFRGGKRHDVKGSADAALADCPSVSRVIVVQRDATAPLALKEGRDVAYAALVAERGTEQDRRAEPMEANDPLFILYTSGSTGKPKGLQHGAGGYLVYASYTFNATFGCTPSDVYWCTADAGWITGHTYLVYGPLVNGATVVMHEGVPNYPDYSRHWQIVDTYGVTVYYTAPTAIRSLMAQGDAPLSSTSRKTLRLLGTVGEPINPAAWEWYKEKIGSGATPIVDTWWQTETGGHMITALPGVTEEKPGVAGRPLPGLSPVIVESDGSACPDDSSAPAEGALCFAAPWPGMAQTVYGDHALFLTIYFSSYPGYYFSGDGATRDEDGHYRIAGRMDDTLNVSGHRLGTAEIESALVAHAKISEAAVVGYPHAVKGEAICAYVVPNAGETLGAADIDALKERVREDIGAIARPDRIIVADALPKTRSGKIMRRILRKIAAGDADNLGDLHTLLNPEAVEDLIKKARPGA